MKLLLILGLAVSTRAQDNQPSYGLLFPPVGTAIGFKDSNGNLAAGLLDLNGNLKISFSGSSSSTSIIGTVTTNQTQLAGVNLGPPTTYGTAPLLEKVIGVNAFVTNPVTVLQGTVPLTIAGNVSGFRDFGGSNIVSGNLDAFGNLKVTVAPQNTFPSSITPLPRTQPPIPVITNSNPCQTNVPGDAPVSQTGTVQIISGRPGMRILVCHERILAGAAEQISEIEGTGAACGTGTIVHSGSSTATNGEPLAANGGFETNVPFYLLYGNNYCIQQAGTARVAGKVSYLYVP